MSAQLRRAVDEAMNRTGMTVGLPKCTVDASQLQHLLDKCEAVEAEVGIAVAERVQIVQNHHELMAMAAAECGMEFFGDDTPHHMADRIRELEAEVARLKAGGCGRDQRITQYCAEAVALQAKLRAVGEKLHRAEDLLAVLEAVPSRRSAGQSANELASDIGDFLLEVKREG